MLADTIRIERLRALSELERREHLFDYRVDGWSAWRVMRNPVHALAEGLPLAVPLRSTGGRVLAAILATMRLLWLLAEGRRRELIVKTSRSGLRIQVGRRYRDVYFDGLLSRHPSFLKLEEINSSQFDAQAAVALHPAGLDPVVLTFWGRVLSMVRPAPVQEFCDRVAALLARDVGIDVDARWLRARVSTAYWQARIAELMLRRLRPRAVLVSDTGEYGMLIAGQRCGVPVIELQHGIFNAHHPDAVPSWVQGGAAELVLPRFLACRGEYWLRRLEGTRQGDEAAVVVGDEAIDTARLTMLPRAPAERLHIVVTSQGLDTERLSRWVGELLAAAPAHVDCRVSLKLHPQYDAATRSYDRLDGDPRLAVIHGSERPNVFELLCDADLHLSITSACHFDAAALGVPTGILPFAGHEILLEAVDGKRIVVIEHPEEAWRLAAELGVDTTLGHYYAKPGFIDNLARLIPA